MHTRAAVSQSLHEHLLAYVKQNLPPAKPKTPRVALALIALCLSTLAVSGCAKLTPRASSAIQPAFDSAKVAPSSLININSAAAEELERLPGVGKVIAERIIAHRQQYGAFRRTEHLMMVRGISDRKFRELRPMIVAE